MEVSARCSIPSGHVRPIKMARTAPIAAATPVLAFGVASVIGPFGPNPYKIRFHDDADSLMSGSPQVDGNFG